VALWTACIRKPASCPLCSEDTQVRSGCWMQTGDNVREDAGKMPAVRDGRLHYYYCFENDLLRCALRDQSLGCHTAAAQALVSLHALHFRSARCA